MESRLTGATGAAVHRAWRLLSFDLPSPRLSRIHQLAHQLLQLALAKLQQHLRIKFSPLAELYPHRPKTTVPPFACPGHVQMSERRTRELTETSVPFLAGSTDVMPYGRSE